MISCGCFKLCPRSSNPIQEEVGARARARKTCAGEAPYTAWDGSWVTTDMEKSRDIDIPSGELT